jgi:hypothetical protein
MSALPAFEPEEATERIEAESVGFGIFGPLVVSVDVDDAVLDVCRTWMRTHLRRLAKERGIELEVPKEWAIALTDAELLDHRLPAVVSETAQMDTAPRSIQGGTGRFYSAAWRVALSVTVRGRDAQETRRTASLYEGVLRRLMLQHGHEKPLDWIHFTGMTLGQVPGDQRNGRYLLKGTSNFLVRSDEIVDPTVGPNVPDLEDYIGPVVKTVDVDVIKEPLP